MCVLEHVCVLFSLRVFVVLISLCICTWASAGIRGNSFMRRESFNVLASGLTVSMFQ